MEIGKPLQRGLTNGLSITFMMVKVIVPCYIAIEIIKHSGLIDIISRACTPFMSIFGLPGEAALCLVAGYIINIYAAIAVLTPLGLPAKDVTVIALMLGICHSLTIETPITKKTGANASLLLLVRIALSLFSGVVLHLLWK
ncbi:MAG TPA: nucleoside recognition domain-containing protein [Syntrophorhabdales bacterium]|nr:nucleoside recognition domain-containing protein [Syntrophorhabdales bacterium]